ncbi:MAG: LPS export ABC transporter periplasmic protein LptC [bacterium]|nr:LPS export ABC transporter periplasmic protein LptC [bacterium]
MTRRPLALLALLVLAACNPKAPAPTATPSSAASPSASPLALTITGKGTAKQPVRIVQTRRDNRRQYELLASSYQSTGAVGTTRARFEDVRVRFYGTDGSMLQASAPQAIVDQKANTIELRGGVHAKNSQGATLACDDLIYDRGTEMLHGTGHVAITDPGGFSGTGNRFDSNVSLTTMRMQ